MREICDKIETEHFRAVIHYDDYAENPRKFSEPFGTLYVTSKYADSADGEIKSAEDLETLEKRKDIIWLPVYAYIHSGVAVNTTGFSCPWDSGRLGITFVTKRKAREEMGWKRLSRKRIAQVEEILKAELEEWGEYLNGNVYGVEIIEKGAQADDDEPNVMWGLYGYHKAYECAQTELEWRENHG